MPLSLVVGRRLLRLEIVFELVLVRTLRRARHLGLGAPQFSLEFSHASARRSAPLRRLKPRRSRVLVQSRRELVVPPLQILLRRIVRERWRRGGRRAEFIISPLEVAVRGIGGERGRRGGRRGAVLVVSPLKVAVGIRRLRGCRRVDPTLFVLPRGFVATIHGRGFAGGDLRRGGTAHGG